MKQIKKDVVKEQIFYELSKEELDKIKRDERISGRYDVIHYILFCSQNFKLKLNIAGTVELCADIISFVTNKSNFIRNTYNYTFEEYLNRYRQSFII